MRLYIDLRKSEEKPPSAPPTGGGAAGASPASATLSKPAGPPAAPKLASGPPKTPGAATGGSGAQVVDCPLGPACPDGGHHQMGSATLQEHTKQVQTQMKTGMKPGDESQGQSANPGVPQGAQNMGSVGSDQAQVNRTPPPVPGADNKTMDVKTGELKEPGLSTMMTDAGAKGYDPDAPDERQTLSEATIPAKDDAEGEGPGSKRSTLAEPVMNVDPDKTRQNVPNPMVADEAAVPHDSKPMDHYRLSKVARESGDEDLAKFHEGMARKRTEGGGSEDHKELATQLHAEGMHDQAKYHEGIHDRVNGGDKKAEVPVMTTKDQHQQLADLGYSKESRNKMKPEEAHEILGGKKHESGMRDVHHEARTKAAKDLADAHEKHKNLQSKAEELKNKNKEALDKYEQAKKDHEKLKAQGKKRAAPVKPKLEKEEKVPERPELDKPSNDHEKLVHETHTARAQKLADLAESHLKGNKDLSSGERSRLERAHQIATYHANIGYTPTASHKKELGDAESAVSGMGLKENHDDMKAKEDAQVTAAAAKAADQDRQAQEKQSQKQAKVDEKTKAAEAKQQAKQAGEQPKPPVTDLDHARVQDHQSKARKLREALETHMAQNPNISPEDHKKAEHILTELEKHEQMDMVPGKAHQAELKELQTLSGDIGKEPFDPDKPETGGGGSAHPDTGGSYAINMLHQGRALGQTLGSESTNASGAGGQIAGQLANYGVSGSIQAGHRLLHDSNQQSRMDNKPLPPPPEDKAKPAAKVPA